MSKNSHEHGFSLFRIRMLASLCLLIGTLSTVVQADEVPSASLTELGLELETARNLEGPLHFETCEMVEHSLMELLAQDSRLAKREHFQLLLGAVRQEMGNFEGARVALERAKDNADKGPHADDAAFAAVEALEASGDDERAAEAWAKWLKKYKNSPLRAEARLSASWNALRRGELIASRRDCVDLLTEQPWLEGDTRIAMLQATLAFVDGDTESALKFLARTESSAAALFLTALCRERSGASIKAAASFQEIVDRHPHSPLRDHAQLAKANIFFRAGALESASEDYARLTEESASPVLRAEALLRQAAADYRLGRIDEASALLTRVVTEFTGDSAAARAQFLLGEFLMEQGEFELAIVEYNRVLAEYFENDVAATAQYRIGRCLDAQGRGAEATSAYRAVVEGYPLFPEAPSAAYLAGIGLMEQERYMEAASYFQQVLDRYLASADGSTVILFDSADHLELLEASLCLLEYAYYEAGDLGQLSGTPHLMLQKMPSSTSPWRAYSLLLDADALSAQGRYEDAELQLNRLLADFGEHVTAIPSNQLLAWIYSRQGRDDEAIALEEMLLARYGSRDGQTSLGSSYLNMAHLRFNQKRYEEAADLYEKTLVSTTDQARRLESLYQAGLCYLRLDRGGDAIDRWRTIVEETPSVPAAEKVWSRMADLYFLADRYIEAKQAYEGLLINFSVSNTAPRAMLRLAQCDYNTGDDGSALERYSNLMDRYPGTVYAEEAQRGIEMSLYRLGQQQSGEQILVELVDRFPGSHFAADAQYQIAARLYEAEQYIDAAHAFRRVVSQFPAFVSVARAQYLMADCFQQAGMPEDAKRGYEQFSRFFPESEFAANVQFKLGMIYFQDEDYMRAAISFTTVLESQDPSEFWAASRFNLALCKQLLGRPQQAQIEFERYRELHAEGEHLRDVAFQLGILHDSTDRFEQAIAEYGIALGLRPGADLATELRFRRGSCYERMGDQPAALTEYRKALAVKSGDDALMVSAAARCAAIYEEAEDYPNALDAYKDLMKYSKDPELVAVASDRITQLEAIVR